MSRWFVDHFFGGFVLLGVVLLGGGPAAPLAVGDDGVTPGELIVEHPTLHNLGFEWPIEGDDDRDASVRVEFRKVGEPDWKPALPLLRIGGERIYRQRENLDYTVPHGFAGSILNLTPETEYECRFEMSDADGLRGPGERLVRVKTRGEPRACETGRTLHVYPPDHEGKREEPSFTSLLHAYYGAGLGDWNMVWERRAQPGDVIVVHAGLYRPDRLNYVTRRWHRSTGLSC